MPDAFMEMGDLIPGIVTQHSRDANATLLKVRDVRAKLYKQMPSEYMERFPLTKIVMSKKGKPAKSVKVEWGMEALNDFSIKPTGVYDSVALNQQIGGSAATAANTIVYVKCTEAEASKARALEEIELRHLSTTGIQGTVQLDISEVQLAGNASYLKCTTLHDDDDNTLGKTSLLHGSLVGMAVPEASKLPPGRYVEPTTKYNYSQTVMSALQMSGSELADVEFFDEDQYNRHLRQTHEDFHTQVERAIKFGTRYAGTVSQTVDGYTKTCKRYKMGGLKWAHRNEGGNYLRIPELTTFGGETYTGQTWAEYGYPFMKNLLNVLSAKSGSKKRLLASNTVMMDIMDMFETMTNVTIGGTYKDAWGFEVTEIRGLNCKLELHQDAGLSTNDAWANTVFIVEPGKIEYRPRIGRDFTVIRSKKDLAKAQKIENGFGWIDAIQEGMYSDFTITYDDLDGMAVIEGWGRDFAAA
jgi:hypothetical protein